MVVKMSVVCGCVDYDSDDGDVRDEMRDYYIARGRLR